MNGLSDAEFHASGRLPNGATIRCMTGHRVAADELPRILELLQASFNDRWPAFELATTVTDHLRWKLEGPSSPASFASLVERDGRLVAMSIAMHTPAIVRERRLEFEIGGDACTHPDFERQGMYHQRKDFEQDTVDAWLDGSLSFSLNPTVLRSRRREAEVGEGFEPANRPRVLLKVYRARELASDRVEAGSRLPAAVLRAVFLAARAPSVSSWIPERGARDIRVRWVDRFDERVDELSAQASQMFDLYLERSARYLNWRFCDLRGGRYRVLLAERGDELVGYLVLKVQKQRGYILDVLARPGDEKVVAVLLGHADRAFRAESVSGAVCWLPRRHPYRGALRRFGFIDTRQPSGSRIRAYPRVEAAAIEFARGLDARLHITLGDTDWA